MARPTQRIWEAHERRHLPNPSNLASHSDWTLFSPAIDAFRLMHTVKLKVKVSTIGRFQVGLLISKIFRMIQAKRFSASFRAGGFNKSSSSIEIFDVHQASSSLFSRMTLRTDNWSQPRVPPG